MLLQSEVNIYYKVGQLFFITKWGRQTVLQSGAAFFYYKVRQANCVTKWGSSFITKWGRFYYKVEQVLQSGASFITKLGRYYKVGHYYKVVHNKCKHKWKFCSSTATKKIDDSRTNDKILLLFQNLEFNCSFPLFLDTFSQNNNFRICSISLERVV